MTVQCLTVKAMLVGLVIMLCSFCITVHAAGSVNSCEVTSGKNINFKNVNLTTDEFTPGVASVIYSVTQPVRFECYAGYYNLTPKLVLNQPYFSSFSKQLSDMGLGLQFTITEDGQSPVLVSWTDIKDIASGNEKKISFGKKLEYGVKSERNATIKMDFLYTALYSGNSTIKDFAAMNNVLNIIDRDDSSRDKGFFLSGFNVKILRRGLGKIDILPQNVNFGRFYTTWKPSQTKQANFTVTASQKLGAATDFTVPLDIKFESGAFLTSPDGQALKLVSQDGPNAGQSNGLLLSITDDDTQGKITFNKKEAMGSIDIYSLGGGFFEKKYTAKVTPETTGDVKTGKFTAAVNVTVTYN
ncbi:hypothetical protein EBP34_25385 [Salmonella enterica subsp. enterica serovar Saintpaul]|nr:hypothetical protein [Salmonella enterica subsp. enterica serovar Saintpaul]EHJ0807157.1 hypothetical protein [Salmonella enterica]